MAIEISSFRSYEKNTLRGFFTVRLTEVGLEIRDCTIHKKNDGQWIGLPSRPYEDKGETKYSYIVKFYDKERWEQFQKATIGALDQYLKSENQNKEAEGEIPF